MAFNWNKQTHTYKTIGDCRIQADVYQTISGKMQPALLWIHGGALIAGNRSIIPYQLGRYLEAGFTVVSIDYRLAPETKLPAIIEDLKDAVHWIRDAGPDLFSIDANQLSVVGHSAGGYLALVTGYVIDPPPKAIISFYGYGDIIGPWYSQPDPWYCKQKKIDLNKAYEAVGITPLTEGEWDKRSPFYIYCRQHGLWPQEVAGQNPQENPDWFSQYSPLQNVNSNFPPTLLIHGDQDTDVPLERSLEMYEACMAHKIDCELLVLQGREHAFDSMKDAQQDQVVSRVFEQVIAFIRSSLKRDVSVS